MNPGDRVRFTVGPLGAVHADTRRIALAEFNAGDEGIVIEWPYREVRPDERMIRTSGPDGREYDVPIFTDMAEVIS